MCLPKKLGRAGVVNLKVKNCALMAKCGWRFATERNALWGKVIYYKYGASLHGWRFKTAKPKEISVVWRGIVENSKSEKVSKWMSAESFRWVIRNEHSVLFWEDVWCGNKPFKVEFLRLYRLVKERNCLVKDVVINNSFEGVN